MFTGTCCIVTFMRVQCIATMELLFNTQNVRIIDNNVHI